MEEIVKVLEPTIIDHLQWGGPWVSHGCSLAKGGRERRAHDWRPSLRALQSIG